MMESWTDIFERYDSREDDAQTRAINENKVAVLRERVDWLLMPVTE